jgi:hypothetical protein
MKVESVGEKPRRYKSNWLQQQQQQQKQQQKQQQQQDAKNNTEL